MATYNLGNVRGPQGPQGEQGPAGAAATVSVGTVTTGAAGSSASVTNSGTSQNAVFDFVIPKGDSGAATAADVAYTDTNEAFEASDNIDTVQKAIDKLAEGDVGLPTFNVVVKYLDESNTEHAGTSSSYILGSNYDVSNTLAPAGFVLDGLASNSDPASGVINRDINVIYKICVDAWNSSNNTLTGGDGTADKYEVVFQYVSGGHGTVTGITTKVVNLGTGVTSATLTPGTTGITLTPDTLYHFDAWDVDPDEELNVTGGQTYTFTATFTDVELYSFFVDTTKSVPTEMIEYPADSANANYTPARLNSSNVFDYGDWGNAFFMKNTKPCMLKYDGTVDYYLDKNNFNMKEDGTTHSNLNNQNYDGNVMIEFPQVWICVSELAADGASATKPRIFVSSHDISDSTHTYHAYAHTDFNGALIDKIYMPAYEGSKDSSNRLRSLSGQTVMVSQTGTTERLYAQYNNSDKLSISAVTQDPVSWDMSPLCDHELLIILCLLISKSTNNQEAFGKGLSNMSGATVTGGASGISNTSGFFFGTNANGTTPVKVFGVENPWGNVWMRKTGCVRDASKNLRIKMTPPYLTDPAAETTLLATYDNLGLYSGGDGYVKACIINEKGFFPSTGGGSETTYYCDYQHGTGSANTFAFFGGSWNYGGGCGLFYWYLSNAVSYTDTNIGSSVSCKPLAA